jgi:hypothetical protein
VVALVSALLILVVLCSLVVPMSKRRPVGTPLTWGEAMVASVYSFFLMFWAYGVIPHLWLSWADNELQWRPDKLLFGPGAILKPVSQGGGFPMTLSYQTLRDFVAVGIYVIFLGGQMALWAYWQNRGTRAAAATSTAVVESEFGRPLVRKG